MVSTPPIFADSAGLTIIIINRVCAFVNVSWIETFEQGFHLNVSLDASQLGISLATTTSSHYYYLLLLATAYYYYLLLLLTCYYY